MSGLPRWLGAGKGRLRVREVLQRGDDCPLPTNVMLQGLEVPIAGTYDVFNARVSSNGDIELVVDEKTWLAPAVNRNGFDGSYTFS